MSKGNLFIRINYSLKDEKIKEKCKKAYIRKSQNLNREKYLIGGGYLNKSKGSFMFQAKNLKEANSIVKNNILSKDRVYKYELTILDKKIPNS